MPDLVADPPRVLRFGIFESDARTGVLHKRGSAQTPRFIETLPRRGRFIGSAERDQPSVIPYDLAAAARGDPRVPTAREVPARQKRWSNRMLRAGVETCRALLPLSTARAVRPVGASPGNRWHPRQEVARGRPER